MLTWSSSTDKSNAYIRTLSDLNLELLDKETGEIIGRCASFTDNHEVIDIPNFKLEENREYSLEILIDDIIFPQDGATRDYIKYSLGWTWVNDFGGKSFIDTTFTGDNEFNLLNRNIVFNKNTNFADNSTTFITAGERIELNPGVVIEEGAEFTTGIANQEVKYDAPALNEYGHISSSSDARLADYSGNNRNGWLEGADSVDLILNRYCQIPYSSGSPEASGAIFLNGDASYWLSSPGYPDGNPKYAGGLTLSMCIKFYKDTVSTGYIFTSYSELRGEGYYLRVDDIDKYNKQLIFHISGRGEQSEINADIDQEDLEGWVKAQPEPYNWGWVHVSAVWKAGDYVSLYVNGINKTSYVSTDVEFCPTDNLCYIGKDPKLMPEAKSFKGGVDEVRLYSGPISGDDIYAEYHRGGFPVQWQQDRYKLTLWVGAGGIADLDLIYTDIEDISPPDTVEGESEKVFIVSRGFDVKMRFIADEGYKVDNVKKINLSNDVVIDLGEIQSHKMTQYGFKREKYRFEVTFIEDTQ